MANVDKDACKEFRTALGREIGETKQKADDAKKCAMNKVEKTNFRWTIGIVISAVGGILLVLFLYSVSNGKAINETKETTAGMVEKVGATKEKVDGLDRDLRDFRTEQRIQLEELKDLVKKNH